MKRLLILLLSILQRNLIIDGCYEGEYQCFDGQCIPLDQFCDYDVHCKDGSDEKYCFEECLLRHDVYGTSYKGRREITRDGQHCSTKCLGTEGRGVVCKTENNTLAPCYIPYCDNQKLINVDCSFQSNFCGWRIHSNSSFDSWISEDHIGYIQVNVNYRSLVVLSSPVLSTKFVTDTDWVIFNYSVERSKNSSWTSKIWMPSDMREIPRPLFDENVKMTFLECQGCTTDELLSFHYDDVQTMVYFYFYVQCKHGCNVTLKLHSIKSADEGTGLFHLMERMENCPFNEYPCYRSPVNCIPIESLLDQDADCYIGQDTIRGITPKFSCQSKELMCNHSTCPGSFECKRSVSDLKPICLEQHEICDGTPHCPNWNDELNCETFCPPECYSCEDMKFICAPSAIDYIHIGVSYLDLSDHPLNITHMCSRSFLTLTHLNVSRCHLSNVSCLFNHKLFPSLRVMDLSYNNITVIERNSYPYVGVGTILYLDGNPLAAIDTLRNWKTVLIRNSSLKNLQWSQRLDGLLTLNFNVINSNEFLPSRHFSDFQTNKLDLSYNAIESITFLKNFAMLFYLNLSNNKLSDLSELPFLFIPYLKQLHLNGNQIDKIDSTLFMRKEAIEILNLARNNILTVDDHSFQPVKLSLRNLSLSNNVISSLPRNVFQNLTRLLQLDLHGNRLNRLHPDIFKDLIELRILHINDNRLSSFPNNIFKTLYSLEELNLAGNNIKLYEKIFAGLGKLRILKVEYFTLCCARPPNVEIDNCIARSKQIYSCLYLLQHGFLGVAIWYISILIVFLNCSIIILERKRNKAKVGDLFIQQYMFTDILMGLTLLIIAFIDVYYKGRFGLHYNDWVKGPLCILTDILGTLSIQASTLLTLVVSMYYRQCIPPRYNIGRHKILLVTAFIWLISILCVFPNLLMRTLIPKDYNVGSSLCLTLPIIDQTIGGGVQKYTEVLYLVINPFLYVSILLNEGISIIMRKRNQQDRIFIKRRPSRINGLVLNNCTRYFLFAVIGLMELFGIDVFDGPWLTVFVLPINSILNLVWLIKVFRF